MKLAILYGLITMLAACGAAPKALVDRRTGTQISGTGGNGDGTGTKRGDGNKDPNGGSSDNNQYLLFGNLKVDVPKEWIVNQDAIDDGTRIVGIQTETSYLTLYVKKDSGALDIQNIFASSGATVVQNQKTQKFAGTDFQTIVTQKDQTFIAGFTSLIEQNGYYGYAKADQQAKASDALAKFLGSLK